MSTTLLQAADISHDLRLREALRVSRELALA